MGRYSQVYTHHNIIHTRIYFIGSQEDIFIMGDSVHFVFSICLNLRFSYLEYFINVGIQILYFY